MSKLKTALWNWLTKDNYEAEQFREQLLPNDPIHYCSMCGAPETEVNLIIKGADDTYICEKCGAMIHYQMSELYKYADEIKKKEQSAKQPETVVIPTPHEIKEYLDKFVINQDDAKIKLSVAIYNHYKRVYQLNDNVDIEKSNAILIGESGTGKSLLAKTAAQLLDVPFTIVDANCFTQAGYVGEDVESILTRLYQAADKDVARAEKGIVFIDEIDKIARNGASPSITKDVSGEGVQQALLKILEGTKVRIPPEGGRKHPEKDMIEMDTKNILFICSGAFVGIEKKIEKRMKLHSVGFGAAVKSQQYDRNALLKYLTSEDLQEYGMIPEFIGRVPIIAALEKLDKDALRRILTEPNNAIIKQYIKLFEMDGVKLTFTDEALDFIVDKSIELKLGARSLRTIVEDIMTQYMFDIPSKQEKTLEINKEYAETIINSKNKISA